MVKTMKNGLQIAELVLEDAASLSSLMVANTERFRRFFPKTLAQNMTVNDSRDFILKKKKEIKANEEYTWAIGVTNRNFVAGLIILKELDWIKKQGELAYCIGLEYEGQGWVTKTVTEISNYAFNTLGLKILQIIVHKDNKGSVKVARKCGYIWQRALEKEFAPPNEQHLDMELYELK